MLVAFLRWVRGEPDPITVGLVHEVSKLTHRITEMEALLIRYPAPREDEGLASWVTRQREWDSLIGDRIMIGPARRLSVSRETRNRDV